MFNSMCSCYSVPQSQRLKVLTTLSPYHVTCTGKSKEINISKNVRLWRHFNFLKAGRITLILALTTCRLLRRIWRYSHNIFCNGRCGPCKRCKLFDVARNKERKAASNNWRRSQNAAVSLNSVEFNLCHKRCTSWLLLQFFTECVSRPVSQKKEVKVTLRVQLWNFDLTLFCNWFCKKCNTHLFSVFVKVGQINVFNKALFHTWHMLSFKYLYRTCFSN